jgi:hypothetical protein
MLRLHGVHGFQRNESPHSAWVFFITEPAYDTTVDVTKRHELNSRNAFIYLSLFFFLSYRKSRYSARSRSQRGRLRHSSRGAAASNAYVTPDSSRMLCSEHIIDTPTSRMVCSRICEALELQNALFQTYLMPWISRKLCSKAPECSVPIIFDTRQLQNALFPTCVKPWSSKMLCSKHM